MAKTIRRRLARGTKLISTHVHGPLDGMATEINNQDIAFEQMVDGWAKFTVAIPVMMIDGSFFHVDVPLGGTEWDDRPFCVPFTLPPLQEFFSFNEREPYEITYDTPKVILTEAMLSLDTQDEPATIAGPRYNGASGDSAQYGLLDYNNLNPYDLTFSMMEKNQWFLADGHDVPDRELFSQRIPFVALIGTSARLNPLMLTDINKPINPYKTLVAFLYCQNLLEDSDIGTTEEHVIVSLWMNFTFKTNLVARDTGQAIQNIPDIHDGSAAARTVTITSPNPNDVIEAEHATEGISVNQHAIDEVFQEGFQGGYTEHSEARPVQEILHDAAYDVITIPLMNNRRENGISGAGIIYEPYSAAPPPSTDAIAADHGWVKIQYPFTIHHVILAFNWQAYSTFDAGGVQNVNNVPASASLVMEVGLNLTSGLRSDLHTNTPIALLELTGPLDGGGLWTPNQIDRVKCQDYSATRGGTTDRWDWELHQVPLYTNGGEGHYTQGEPFFVGKANSQTRSRRAADFGGPATDGCEQHLYARMLIRDALVDMDTSDADMFTGYGGHFLYVICKKHMVGFDG